ncbi:MAG: MDR family MFS transporter [Phaeovulum sp.]|uniref:MDR family MFS transporter n=1 Tax=Phaeovulum sp. TaxID=2934796 RepID=UPI0027372FCA|nr:MDR family MFS transporter [Phaeovulum sp.]MDP3862876.1 MDR family MFS transporter [Phaeovulum sp.]
MSAQVPVNDHIRSPRLILAAIAMMLLLASLDQTIVSTALPTIVAELGGIDHLSWVITAYLLTSTVVAPLYGKLGDLYGRKLMMQISVVLFLAGSALAGQATSMLFLIAARGLQGVGGGGLFVLALTVIADVVPPRERGKIQGIFGGVFSLSSIGGPLIGGYLTEHLSWRWIFYVNLPLGIFALVVFALAFKPRGIRTGHRIDYLGAVLLTTALSAVVLFTSLGGRSFAWDSGFILGLIALAAVTLPAFVLVERRAAEPILPLALFSHSTFVLFSAIGAIVGAAMFGAATFLPLYLQVAKGISPTASGLQMMPMMLGIMAGSIGSGQIMGRTGHYRRLPQIGMAVLVLGMASLTLLSPDTSRWALVGMMALVGLGMGPTMSVGTTAIQNAVPRHMLGVATSGFTLFRQVGGSVGIAVFGAMFASGLAARLAGLLPPGADPGTFGAAQVAALPEAARAVVASAFTEAMHPIFAIGAALAAVALVLSFLIVEKPLENTIGRPGQGGAH